MSAFTYEIANVQAAVGRAYPAHPESIYAIPWYLVIGEPGSGKTTALQAMNLTWNQGNGPLQIGLPQQQCTYWMPQEAVFIEPGASVIGPACRSELLDELCRELRSTRPREPVDGIILVINVAAFIDCDEAGVDAYANTLRRYLIEVNQALHADVPVYVVLSRYDTLWGFAEVFQWGPDRVREDPWGFVMPADTPSQQAVPRILAELDGLNARIEAFCLAKLSSNDHPELRTRAFQHLAEVRAMMEKLRALFSTLAMANSFERAPWIRAVTVGSAVPGLGDRLRARVQRFFNMGLSQPATQGATRPGGLPIHAFMKTVVLPDKDIVPLRVRWRDDKVILICSALGLLLWIGAFIAAGVFAASK